MYFLDKVIHATSHTTFSKVSEIAFILQSQVRSYPTKLTFEQPHSSHEYFFFLSIFLSKMVSLIKIHMLELG